VKDNIDNFVQTIRDLKDDPKLPKIVGKRARNSAITRFSIDEMVNQYIEIYAELLNHVKV
jgi:glycosyltransferase involved in cell wall biosynthesis